MQTFLNSYLLGYEEQDNEAEIEEIMKTERLRRKIGNALHKKILSVFQDYRYKDFSINEIAYMLDMERSTISPRMSELRKMGLVVFSETRISRVTGRTNDAYKLVNNFDECVEMVE